MALSDFAANTALDDMFNAGTGFAIAADPYLQLHNGDPGVNGTTNIAGDNPRQQFAVGAASGRTLSNSAIIDFTSMLAVTTPGVVAWSVWDVADATPTTPAGNCFWTGWFSNVVGQANVRDENLAGNTIDSPTHGMINDDRVVFEAVEGLTVPTGITAGTLYWVLAATDDDFTISTTQDGAAVDITAEGQCLWRKVPMNPVSAGNTFRIAAGDLDFFM
jgi:hypothetical protein